MTIAEFVSKLPADGQWQIEKTGHISRTDGYETCPINRVAGYPGWCQAANRGVDMGLAYADCILIMEAADSRKGCNERLRQEILRQVGLA